MTMRTRIKSTWASGVLALLALVHLAGCAAPPAVTGTSDVVPPNPHVTAVETIASYGVRISGLHLSAHGYILDLRYRVLDPEKAAPLLDAKRKVYLVDDNHHARLGVPSSPKIGGMRQTSRNHVIYTDRDYFILFVNPGRAVRQGDILKLALDDTTVAELKVE
jgi:hypothetical protein